MAIEDPLPSAAEETALLAPASTGASAESGYPRPESRPVTPWRFLPILYVMQALPVSIVQELMTIVYKDLGVSNESILKWTAVIALPWSLQMLLGPMVDLTGTKREWVLRCQLLIAAMLAAVPFLLNLPYAFELSLLTLGGVAIVSAIANTATDGFYLLAIPNKDVQASFAGVQSTAYRVGTLIVGSLLVFVAGWLAEFRPARIEAVGGMIAVTQNGAPEFIRSADLRVNEGKLSDAQGRPLIPSVEIPPSLTALTVESDGRLLASESGRVRKLGRLAFFRSDPKPGGAPEATEYRPTLDGVGLAARAELVRRLPIRTAWTLAVLLGAGLYILGFLFNRGRIPTPAADRTVDAAPGELRGNISRTLAIVGLYGATYFTLSAIWKLAAHTLSGPLNKGGWRVQDPGKFLGWDLRQILGRGFGLSGVEAEALQFAVLLPTALALLFLVRRSIAGTAMGEAFSTFFRQPRIVAILGFVLFYRFGEAMVNGTAPLFLKGLPSEGGLGIGNQQLGTLNGFTGIGGMIVGGIAGGWIVGRIGLRRSIWPLVLVMHLPNLLYLWAAIVRPSISAIYVVNFLDKFGYGFGFAAYFVILQRIAQRGNFATSHYAIGVGLGAACIALAKVVSAILEKQFGFVGFFVGACLLTIPGMLAVLFVPLGDEPAEAKTA